MVGSKRNVYISLQIFYNASSFGPGTCWRGGADIDWPSCHTAKPGHTYTSDTGRTGWRNTVYMCALCLLGRFCFANSNHTSWRKGDSAKLARQLLPFFLLSSVPAPSNNDTGLVLPTRAFTHRCSRALAVQILHQLSKQHEHRVRIVNMLLDHFFVVPRHPKSMLLVPYARWCFWHQRVLYGGVSSLRHFPPKTPYVCNNISKHTVIHRATSVAIFF